MEHILPGISRYPVFIYPVFHPEITEYSTGWSGSCQNPNVPLNSITVPGWV
jgi:hypothetical protein